MKMKADAAVSQGCSHHLVNIWMGGLTACLMALRDSKWNRLGPGVAAAGSHNVRMLLTLC